MFDHNLPVMNSKYPPEQIRRCIEAFQAGKSYREIAVAERMPYPTVFWHVKKALGLPGRRPGRKKTHVGKTNAEISRAWQLQDRYGITQEQYDAMHAAQGGVCAICGKPPKGGRTSSKNLHVDHDHATGKIRGLLCNDCNPGLGKFMDDPNLLRLAAAYLERHG